MKDSTISVARVRAIYDRAYSNPGLMGTHLDKEYSQVTKTTLIDMCRNGVPHRILDLGTGDGDLWQFAPRQWEWHAIDISPIGVRRTIDRFSNVLGAAAIAENLPYPTGYFGVVIAADTVEHVFDLRACVVGGQASIGQWRLLCPFRAYPQFLAEVGIQPIYRSKTFPDSLREITLYHFGAGSPVWPPCLSTD